MAKIDDVAKLAGVSTATVSAVVNGQDVVKPKTRRRVLDAIRTLNYQPNLYARSLARGRSRMLGIVISDIVNPFFAEIAQVSQAEALVRGYQVLISSTQFSVDRLTEAVQHMIGMRVDGLIIMTSEMDEKMLDALRRRKTPVIFEDVGTVDKTTANLRIDYEGGIYRAVRFLVELGHERILFAENHPSSVKAHQLLSHRLRADAFEAAVARFPSVVASTLVCPGKAFQAGLEGANQAVRTRDFTGVVANADPLALGLLPGFRRTGKRVPEDVSVIGFDNSPPCEYTDPPLTSVSISCDAIGKAAVETLIGMIEEGKLGSEIHIPTDLVMRESAGRPPAAAHAGRVKAERRAAG
jgi:LacI family transcriptional regulator